MKIKIIFRHSWLDAYMFLAFYYLFLVVGSSPHLSEKSVSVNSIFCSRSIVFLRNVRQRFQQIKTKNVRIVACSHNAIVSQKNGQF